MSDWVESKRNYCLIRCFKATWQTMTNGCFIFSEDLTSLIRTPWPKRMEELTTQFRVRPDGREGRWRRFEARSHPVVLGRHFVVGVSRRDRFWRRRRKLLQDDLLVASVLGLAAVVVAVVVSEAGQDVVQVDGAVVVRWNIVARTVVVVWNGNIERKSMACF